MKDLINKKFNKLTVIEKLEERINGSIAWKCRCDCGNIRIVNTISLNSSAIKSCKVCKNALNNKDIPIGKTFNYLTILGEVKSSTRKNSERKHRQIECRCVCGKEKVIQLRKVVSGKVKSCGCKKVTNKKDLSTITYIKSWRLIKKESKVTWLCQCTKCKTTRILSHNYLVNKKICNCNKCTTIKKYKKYNINIGEMFGDLLVIDKIGTKYKCECYCGNTITTTYSKLKNGAIKDCGCTNNKNIELIGKKFGRLLVVSKIAKRKGSKYVCLCTCGKSKIVNKGNLLNNNTRSCGCLQFEIAYQGIHFRNKQQKEKDKLRNTKKYKNWRISVFRRDNNICQICNNHFETADLRAHHLLAFSKHKDLRYKKNNGITLCVGCHNKFHNIYTSTNFDINNFVEFKKQYDHQS